MKGMKIFDILINGTIGSIRSVFRHKQRSFSLIAGMILGAGILGGIFIYTDILNEANYNSIVHGVDYEVRFDIKQAPTAQDNYSLASITNSIKQNSMVEDAIMMYGQGRQKIVQSGSSTAVYQSTLMAQFPNKNSNPYSVSAILGVHAVLLNQSDVGSSKIIDTLSKSVFEGSFNISDRGVVIPQTLADTNQLHVGSVTNITLYISGTSSLGLVTQYNLTNAVITGIYRSSTSGGGNIITSILSSQKIYTSFNEVQVEHPELISKLKSEEMDFIAVKINPNKLSLSDSAKANSQINQFMNEIIKEYPGTLIGTNEISNALLGSQAFSILILLFDFFITIPVFILGIYLITFGAQMALEDRKKEIAIYKIQGASAQQIMKSVFGEIIILILIGSILGYGVSVLVGLSNSLAIGYGKFDFGPNFSKLFQALGYLKFNYYAYAVILIFGGGILLFFGYHHSKKFIEAEVATTLFKTKEDTQSFFFRYWIDYIMFGWGTASLLKALANQYIFAPGHGIDLGIYGLFIDVPAPLFFWAGGALFISRLSRVIPAKLDKFILKLRYLSDVRVMIFADLRRRTVNTSKIALIIALAISFAALASVQGTTHEMNINRQVGWEVGADIQMKLNTPAYGTLVDSYLNTLNVSGIQSVLPLGSLNGQILNDPVSVFFADSELYAKSPYLQSDAFNSGSFSSLSSNYKINALVGSSVLSSGVLNIGDKINMGVTLLHYNGTGFSTSEVTTQITIVGSISHLPGGITPGGVFVDYRFIQNLYNATPAQEFNAYNNIQDTNAISSLLHMNINSTALNNYYPANTFLIQTSTSADTVQASILSKMGSFSSNVFDTFTYADRLANARDLSSSGFGIAGLLTAMFFISLLSATIGTFIFISLVVRSRSKEFAVLRALGGTKGQIYKIALSEVISVLIFALIAGTLLGLGLAYMFNGFFSFLAVFSGTLTYNVPRKMILPWDTIVYSMIITAIIIIIATILPTRRVANQEIIEETRQI